MEHRFLAVYRRMSPLQALLEIKCQMSKGDNSPSDQLKFFREPKGDAILLNNELT